MSPQNLETPDADDSSKRKRTRAVRATRLQTETLTAAYASHKLLTTQELERLSAKTGLTPEWIKAWAVRYKTKARKDGGEAARLGNEIGYQKTKEEPGSELEDDVPPKKKRLRPRIDPQVPPTASQASRKLPLRDASYPPPMSSLVRPAASASKADDSLIPRIRPPLASHAPPGYAHHNTYPLDPTNVPHPLSTGISKSGQHKSSTSNPQPAAVPCHPMPYPRATLLLPQLPENTQPGVQIAFDHDQPTHHHWGTDPASTQFASTAVPGAFPHGPYTRAPQVLGTTFTSNQASNADFIPAGRMSQSLQNQQAAPQATRATPRELARPVESAPLLIRQPSGSPSLKQHPQPWHNNPMITPSHEHDTGENHPTANNSTSTSATPGPFNTHINDGFLLTSVTLVCIPPPPPFFMLLLDRFDSPDAGGYYSSDPGRDSSYSGRKASAFQAPARAAQYSRGAGARVAVG
ncbi:hypothetical protein B0H15DRAFT_858067 [Mycena belliarum]|uniref:Homeobox domain-containing protein n=1 Tax=Mycena belliarum TaxID=1033014 RepID=A0AAD6XM90_9AGAR|nr:hypothetical protein B0H15DRAFT_858067 [Mycena belliae]